MTKYNETATPNIIDSTRLGFKDLIIFDKAMGRSDFWWFILATYLIKIVAFIMLGLSVIPMFTFTMLLTSTFAKGVVSTISVIGILTSIAVLILLKIGQVTAVIRRLHDMNMSGFFALMLLIPTFGELITAFVLTGEQKEENNPWLKPFKEETTEIHKDQKNDNSKLLMQQRMYTKQLRGKLNK